MSQIFNYFICSEEEMTAWILARQNSDQTRQDEIESTMAASLEFADVSDIEVSLLYKCLGGERDILDLDHRPVEVSETDEPQEEGPWVTVLDPAAVRRVSDGALNQEVVERWRDEVVNFHYDDPKHKTAGHESYDKALTLKVAHSLQELFSIAQKKGLYTHCCFCD